MKLTLEHHSVRSTSALDSWVESQIFALHSRLQIVEASVRLAHRPDLSPAYEVNVHLVTAGSDMFAQCRDHTVRAAFTKVMNRLRDEIVCRTVRQARCVRGNLHGEPNSNEV